MFSISLKVNALLLLLPTINYPRISKVLEVNGHPLASHLLVSEELPFTSSSSKFAIIRSKRKTVSHPRYPHHPWSISALFAFPAVKSLFGSSPCLRIPVVKSQP